MYKCLYNTIIMIINSDIDNDDDDDDSKSINFNFHNITDVTCICSSHPLLFKILFQNFSFDLVQYTKLASRQFFFYTNNIVSLVFVVPYLRLTYTCLSLPSARWTCTLPGAVTVKDLQFTSHLLIYWTGRLYAFTFTLTVHVSLDLTLFVDFVILRQIYVSE